MKITFLPAGLPGEPFIPAELLSSDSDDNQIRNAQNPRQPGYWRQLSTQEIDVLIGNRNAAHNWSDVWVAQQFDPALVSDTRFDGLVRIGRMQSGVLAVDSERVAVGIRNSHIVSCDIGDFCTIDRVALLARHIVGDYCILFHCGECTTSPDATFGCGVDKSGNPGAHPAGIELVNECGGRAILAFDTMNSTDAWLWAMHRDDTALLEAFSELTRDAVDARRGRYSCIGNGSQIKHTNVVRNVNMGEGCVVNGADALVNVTLRSSSEEPVRIGHSVEMVDCIAGPGCSIESGAKLMRTLLGSRVTVKLGARVVHSLIGDNSTISCCEVLHALLLPFHEQHHNNSFLIAACIGGQSNMAAGATIGSNHNSRAADGEVHAGRGFWPGLCTSIKHHSRFASFTLLSKADYPAELDVSLPFSLVINESDHLSIIPAFWWQYNMYALARNGEKFLQRDKRLVRSQHIECNPLAPDTVCEIVAARDLLARWTAIGWLRRHNRSGAQLTEEQLKVLGTEVLCGEHGGLADIEVCAEGVEASSRPVRIRNAHRAWFAYSDMLLYYAMHKIVEWFSAHPQACVKTFHADLGQAAHTKWVNAGGQVMPAQAVAELLSQISNKSIRSWEAVHQRYDCLWNDYALHTAQHAYAVWALLCNGAHTDTSRLFLDLDKGIGLQRFVCSQVARTRKKDFEGKFRKLPYRNDAEMASVAGAIENNVFVKSIAAQTDAFIVKVEQLKQRLASVQPLT